MTCLLLQLWFLWSAPEGQCPAFFHTKDCSTQRPIDVDAEKYEDDRRSPSGSRQFAGATTRCHLHPWTLAFVYNEDLGRKRLTRCTVGPRTLILLVDSIRAAAGDRTRLGPR